MTGNGRHEPARGGGPQPAAAAAAAPAPKSRRALELWTAVDVLTGLRYERALVEQLLSGVRGMEESVTYQAIVERGVAKGREDGLAKGRLEGARRILFRQGEKRFREPANSSVRSRIESIGSLDALERLSDRLLEVGSWDELLAGLPAPTARQERPPPNGLGKRRRRAGDGS
jgi:hypothetical protein